MSKRSSRRMLCLAALLTLVVTLPAQDSAETPPANGPRRLDPAWHALVGATVHVSPTQTIENATIVIREGIIRTVGAPAPAGSRVWDVSGRHIYAGFIDAYVEVDAPAPDPKAPGVHWNRKVTPQRRALDGTGLDDKTAKALRKMGFCSAAIAPKGGIFRGRAALVSLAPRDTDESRPPPPVYGEDVYQSVAFERFGRGESGYPTAQMGAIAVIRQALLDVRWLQARLRATQTAEPASLLALADGPGTPPFLFDAADELESLRASKIGSEFSRRTILLGNGMEFRRLKAIAGVHNSIVLPLAFPPRPEVGSVGEMDAIDLRTLMTWEQAPTNPRRLDSAGISVSLTTSKLRRRRQFPRRLREAIRHGLAPERALAMLTTNPAALLGVGKDLGKIEFGYRANLVVADGPIFERETKIRSVWIDGRRYEIEPQEPVLDGEWTLTMEDRSIALRIRKNERVSFPHEGERRKGKHVELNDSRLSFTLDLGAKEAPEVYTFSGGVRDGSISGHAISPTGAKLRWSAVRTGDAKPGEEEEKKKRRSAKKPRVPEVYGTPLGAFARLEPPAPETLRILGATIWTCGPKGVIENGELCIAGGKITYVGPRRKDLAGAAEFVEIDASGKHLAPGIIDCHSHTGISKGINDSGQAVTAEVRIADVTNPDSISWYRQLAAGVTCVNSLHGSANPIGGQNCVNKIRWGCLHPDDMHFGDAPQGIKFALGENVKQSNWGDSHTTRYPQTRMGVETLMRDRFLAARDYLKAKEAWLDGAAPLRRDLELDALAEILAGTRLIHCHSYRQDEILMLCRIAEEFGFKIGTFQHVLEGYKVAEAIRKHARGGSSFSDWWAYKVEVTDAIPQNGAIMHDVGVVVSFNSDSDDLARRLNVEAAKAIKYGGLPPQEALKFVTLNAAIQLGIEKHVGSLEEGKDADMAIWSGSPLSTLSRCEATWVDGRRYFSLKEDRALAEQAGAERRRILIKLQGGEREIDEDEEDEEEGGRRRRRGRRRGPVEAWRRHNEEVDDHRAGDCGCLFREEER